jgi:hypothetical protein
MSRFDGRLAKLEQMQAGAAAERRPHGDDFIRELRHIDRWLREQRMSLWPLCVDIAQTYWDTWLSKGCEPEPADDEVYRQAIRGAFDAVGVADPPGCRFYTLPDISVDFGRHMAFKRREDAERAELGKLANTDAYEPAAAVLRAKQNARRDPRVWDPVTGESRKDPPPEAIAQEILRCYGALPGGDDGACFSEPPATANT